MRQCAGCIRDPIDGECEGLPGFGYPDCYEVDEDRSIEDEWQRQEIAKSRNTHEKRSTELEK